VEIFTMWKSYKMCCTKFRSSLSGVSVPFRYVSVESLCCTLRFYNWFWEVVCDGEVSPLLTYTLTSVVISVQKVTADNPRQMHKVLLHYIIVEIWCAVSVTRKTGPVFFSDTINSECSYGQITAPSLFF